MGELDPGWWGKITHDGFFHVLLGTCSGEGSAAGNVLPPGPPSPFSAASGQGDTAAAGVAGEVVPAASGLPGQESSLFHGRCSVVQSQETHVPVYFQ